MNSLRNSVRLVGNLGMDPDVKSFENNKKLVRLSLATSESYKNDKGERVTETQWHNLALWGNVANFAEEDLKKGDQVTVSAYAAKDPRPLSDGSLHANARSIRMADGHTVSAGTSADEGAQKQ